MTLILMPDAFQASVRALEAQGLTSWPQTAIIGDLSRWTALYHVVSSCRAKRLQQVGISLAKAAKILGM
jgi:hypothetical protein